MACKYGSHRVLEPKGVLPQPALRLDNDFSRVEENEILVDVSALNIDSASFTQIEEEAGGDLAKIEVEDSLDRRRARKDAEPRHRLGRDVHRDGREGRPALAGRDLKRGDRIASLVSLSLTPLKIAKIVKIHPEIDRVEVEAQAVLFESGIYAKLPEDMDEGLALAALDVAGAPAQAAKLVKPGQSVLILGAGGKSGMLVAWEAMKRVGPTGASSGTST